MLDNVAWKVFEKTGNIDIYLIYSDIRKLNTSNEKEHKQEVKKMQSR